MAWKWSVKIALVLISHRLFPAVPSSLSDKQACPPADPGFYSASHIPNTTASWVLIAESSLPGMIETIKRTQLNFSHPAGRTQGPALWFLPPPPLSNYPWCMCGPDCRKLLAVDRCYLPSALNLPPQNGSWWSWPWDPCLHHLVIGRVKDNEVLWRSSMVCIRYLLISVWYPHPFSWLKILLLSFGKLPLFHCVKSHWDYQSEHLATSPHVTKVHLAGFSLIL